MCNIVGAFCDRVTRAELLSLPGVGEETADRTLLYACSRIVWPVDTYCLRVLADIQGTTTSKYMPDPPTIRVKLLAEKNTARVLGAQIVGGPGAAKRIDVIATAITYTK